jgi:hypothetical protein
MKIEEFYKEAQLFKGAIAAFLPVEFQLSVPTAQTLPMEEGDALPTFWWMGVAYKSLCYKMRINAFYLSKAIKEKSLSTFAHPIAQVILRHAASSSQRTNY